ncbi:uncharacterized protein LOC105664552 [Ceratitis capitata]|uniref:uncharacterized protein LOC105664552 n=1 Tax=Ceratitis capitata TaxID=7213 RepID=UPI0006187F1F|nr:uncharacterized protein LOC105664552 [Ceratitis capitata]
MKVALNFIFLALFLFGASKANYFPKPRVFSTDILEEEVDAVQMTKSNIEHCYQKYQHLVTQYSQLNEAVQKYLVKCLTENRDQGVCIPGCEPVFVEVRKLIAHANQKIRSCIANVIPAAPCVPNATVVSSTH